MPDFVPPLNRRDALKLLSLGTGAWILASCAQNAPPVDAGGAVLTQTPETLVGHLTSVPQTGVPAATELPPPAGLSSLPEEFVAGRLTPVEDFYVQSSMGVAKPDPATYRLSLTGLVDSPLELSLADLRSRPAIEVMRTLECIGNPVGGNLIGNTTWTGLSLPVLLAEAGLQAEAKFLHFFSEDGYQTAIPAALGLDERSLLVYAMDGADLPVDHGRPLRALLPGVYGQKQPKWLTSIHAAEKDRLGHWEKKGWSNIAQIKINSRIESPRLRQTLPAGAPYYLTGIAMADTSGIAGVEVSLDGGETWQAAELLPGPDSGVWTLWYWLWADPRPGAYRIYARATDGNGVAQIGSDVLGALDNVFPNGTSLMHHLAVEVV